MTSSLTDQQGNLAEPNPNPPGSDSEGSVPLTLAKLANPTLDPSKCLLALHTPKTQAGLSLGRNYPYKI